MEGTTRRRKKKLTLARAWARLRALPRRGGEGVARAGAGLWREVARAMPPREVAIVVVAGGLAFGLGVALGRITLPPAAPGDLDYVSIERINLRDAKPEEDAPDAGKPQVAAGEAEVAHTAAGGEGEGEGGGEDVGVVGPVPASPPPSPLPSLLPLPSPRTSPASPPEAPGPVPAAEATASGPAAAAQAPGATAPAPKPAAPAPKPATPAPTPSTPAPKAPAPVQRPPASPASRPATPAPASSPRQESTLMPVQGRIISEFGWRRHPVFADWRYHTGIDIAAVEGAQVEAALSGKVLEVKNDRQLGLYVVLEHQDGLRTKYGHLESSPVAPGDRVTQGQSIGRAGSSGVTTGCYVHFEVVRDGKAQNPRDFL